MVYHTITQSQNKFLTCPKYDVKLLTHKRHHTGDTNMAKRLSQAELKNLYLQGTVYTEQRQVYGFESMVFEHKCGNTLEIHTGDEVIIVKAPLPRWMIWGAIVSAPTLLWAIDSAFKIAGY